MIIRRYLTKQGTTVYIPFRYDLDDGTWTSMLASSGSFADPLEAAKVCLVDVVSKWEQIVTDASMLRALCEHPEFDFDGDCIDSRMIRAQARSVGENVKLMAEDLRRLLDSPGEQDIIDLDGKEVPGNKLLTPPESPLDSVLEEATPDDLLLAVLEHSWSFAEHKSEGISDRGYTRALAWLGQKAAEAIRINREAHRTTGGHHEPAQAE